MPTGLARRIWRAGRDEGAREKDRCEENKALALEHATTKERAQLRGLLVLGWLGLGTMLAAAVTRATLGDLDGDGLLVVAGWFAFLIGFLARTYLQADIANAVRARRTAAPPAEAPPTAATGVTFSRTWE